MQTFNSSSLRLWQLISPTLPIGAYCYSTGLEYAVDAGWIKDEDSASDWILGQVKNNLSVVDVPVFLRMYDAWEKQDSSAIEYWNSTILALRESSELRDEDKTLGAAMQRFLQGLDIQAPKIDSSDIAFVTLFSFSCQHWGINKQEAVHGLLWSWCENQVAAAVKLVPLGQTSGQKILSRSITAIAEAIEKGESCDDDDIGLLAPGLAICSAQHETQYSRLFRS